MILLIDHFDSFVGTLGRYVREAGYPTQIVRIDRFSLEGEMLAQASGVILSPGPGTPSDTPVSTELFLARPTLPIFGVCLGFQALAEAYGGTTLGTPVPMHGRSSLTEHDGDPLFEGVPNPFAAGRYHSLSAGIPDGSSLRVIARAAEDRVPMAARHRHRPHMGVQFHPESILTPDGRKIMENFLTLTARKGT